MTQEQYQWLKDNGYDPAVYDVDDQGNIFENPVSAPATQKKMSPLRAAGTSFLGSLAPSAAGLGSAKLGMMAGAPFGPIGVGLGAIGGGLAGGYLAGKGQEVVLERFAPEAIAEMQRAQTEQPVASYVGGFAPNALAFRPSLQGMSGLLRPTVRGEETLRAALSNPNFIAPAANVAANVGASTAGQLINVAEGGEFSGPRFAADVALGTLFNRPTALGRAMGFQDLPQPTRTAAPDLAPARDQAEFMANVPKEFVTPRAERGAQDIAKPGVNIGLEAPEQFFTAEGKRMTEKAMAKDYTNWWKSETEPTVDLLKGAAEEVKAQIPREKLKELANDPEVGEVLRDPSKMAAFVAKQAEESLEVAFQNYRRPAMEAAREVYSPELKGISGRPPSVSKASEGYQFIRPTEPPRSALEAGREVYSAELEGPSGRPPSLGAVAKADKTAYEAYSGQQPPEVVKNATDAAREVYTRLQRAPEEGPARKISQEDINLANEVANRRGLKIELDRAFAGDREVRGMYFVDKDGNRIIRVNPLMATADTAIHEVGHDIFTGVTNKGMRRSLLDTALDSPAYKSELAAREAEVKAGRLTPEAARDIALEEGLIQAFGEKMPGINRGELRSWFKAFKASIKQLATGKLSPEDALAWMHYASTEAVPWKGVAVGKGGEVRPTEERYQRGLTDKAAEAVKTGIDKTLPEIDQITRRGGIYETVGRALTRMYNTAQSMFGRSQAIAPEIYKLSDADAIKLTRHLLQEHRTRTRITPAPEITAAYNEWRNTVKRFWVDENNAVGNTIRQGTGVRERLSDEFWLPFHKESDDVRKILSERVGTPEYQKLKDDYVREATDSYLQKGMNQQDARNKAIADFEQERSVILAPFDPAAPATFAGARKPQGRPLPESWGELNFRDLLENYNRRSAKDYAAQMALERSPEVMTALGAQKMHNDQPIPAAVLQNTPIISTDPSVQSVMREFSGRPLQTPGKFVRGVGSVASALALQTISRIGDIGGTVVKPLAYVGLGDYATYMSGMADKLSNWSQLQLRSIESGLNNPNAHQNFRQAISVGDDAGKYMRRFVDSMGSLTLSNKLEEVARTLAQAQGEMIVSINKRRAATGDKEAIRFLDTLNPDWRTTGDTDLGGQFGLLMQGSYDMRQLPAWFLESGAAPYLTWSKWSMSQLNNFRKFAVEPAMQGDFKPLIAQMLIGMAGGGAIEEIQEWLNNKESKAINWSELQSWAEQNQGEIGSDGGQLLMQKLLMMAQKTGTFGFAGDLMLLPVNALVGDTQGVIGAYPALELTTDLAKNIGGALGAIDKGEDVGLVLKRFGKNMIVGKTQVLRVISNWADELENEGIENLRSADRRKQRLFDELNGMSRAGMFPVSYDNLSEQEFERGAIDEDTGEEALALVTRAREEATSPEDYASRIRKYKTSQNQIMPSLERQPMKAARYLSFVEGAEEGAGAETMRRYMTREYENKYRKSLIEGLSGLR